MHDLADLTNTKAADSVWVTHVCSRSLNSYVWDVLYWTHSFETYLSQMLVKKKLFSYWRTFQIPDFLRRLLESLHFHGKYILEIMDKSSDVFVEGYVIRLFLYKLLQNIMQRLDIIFFVMMRLIVRTLICLAPCINLQNTWYDEYFVTSE